MLCKELGISSVHGCLPDWQWSESADQPTSNISHEMHFVETWKYIYWLIDMERALSSIEDVETAS